MRQFIGFLAGALFSLSAVAAQDVAVSGAWLRATAPGQDSAAVSMHITSSRDARLVGVSSPVAKHAAIHTMKHENGMMVMREVDALALPAKQQVTLGSGDHIMLTGLKRPLKAGDSVPLKLTVEFSGKHRETIAVHARVRPLTASGDEQDMHDMQDMPGMGGMHH